MDFEQNTNTLEGTSQADENLRSSQELLRGLIRASLPVGYFYVDAGRRLVLLNSRLRKLLGLTAETEAPMTIEDFTRILVSRSDRPEITRIELEKNISKIRDNVSFEIPLRGAGERKFELVLFPARTGEGAADFGGLVLERAADSQLTKHRIKILEDLLRQVRKISAASGGNLTALTENFTSWNTELVAEFLKDSSDQLKDINQKLDLLLNFTDIISDQTVFLESVNLGDFLHAFVRSNSALDLYVGDSGSGFDSSLLVQLDPALSRLALKYFLEEVTRHASAAQPVGINLNAGDGFAKISIQSGRTLPLPGLSIDEDISSKLILDPSVDLAVLIFNSQGGDVVIENLPAERGTGLRVVVSLPLISGADPGKLDRGGQRVEGKDSGRILLVESQAEYQVSIQEALNNQGYRVDLAGGGNDALDMVQRINPDGVITARDLPGLDGILLTQGIRRWSAVPVIMLSSRAASEDLFQAYQAGVDDYLKKPFLVEELLLRLRAILRRRGASSQAVFPDIYHSGDIRIDYSTRQVWRKGSPVKLTPIEYNLLVYMTRQGKQIMTYEQLLDRVWEGPEKGTRQGLFVHVKRLREKIESDPKNPQIIRNKWGVGYEFNP
jgi:DNA-binding response OmpR family regulator